MTQERAEYTTASGTDPLLAVYRHDLHKLRGHSHANAAETRDGVPINEAVPLDADADAALLSRPRGEPTQTVENHQTHQRLSLLTGSTLPGAALGTEPTPDTDRAIEEFLQIDAPARLHRAWLESTVPALHNESVYYPYTSLKYHTLLAGALLANYLSGAQFADCSLVVEGPESEPTPFRTVCQTDQCTLTLTASTGDRPAASLGPAPARSWADVWQRLPTHPLATDDRQTRILDAQLRRIRSWSTALQYLEDYAQIADRVGGMR